MGTEAEHRYTQIVVRLTDAEPLPDLPAPADSMSDALCDDTTGEGCSAISATMTARWSSLKFLRPAWFFRIHSRASSRVENSIAAMP